MIGRRKRRTVTTPARKIRPALAISAAILAAASLVSCAGSRPCIVPMIAHAAKECLTCHAPGAFPASGGRPPLRTEDRADGVSCVTCHAAGADARPGATCAELYGKGEILRKAAYCGRCHEDTFKEWNSITTGKQDCTACHMPRTGEGDGIYSDHSLSRGRDVSKRYAVLVDIVSAKRTGAGKPVEAVIALENFATDHGMPTGGYGFRDLRATFELIDRAGRTVDARTIDLLVAGRGDGRALSPRERREYRTPLKDPDGLGVAVRARLDKAGPSGPEATPRAVTQREVE
jgi:hypothetical protein